MQSVYTLCWLGWCKNTRSGNLLSNSSMVQVYVKHHLETHLFMIIWVGYAIDTHTMGYARSFMKYVNIIYAF